MPCVLYHCNEHVQEWTRGKERGTIREGVPLFARRANYFVNIACDGVRVPLEGGGPVRIADVPTPSIAAPGKSRAMV